MRFNPFQPPALDFLKHFGGMVAERVGFEQTINKTSRINT